LFYNTDYFTPEDVLSWDRMLEVAAEAGRMVSMELPSGWWNISFFRGIGLDAWEDEDGSSMININAPGGTDVLQGMLDIAGHPAFISLGGGEIGGAIEDGSVIAAVNGQWNVPAFSEIWGDSIATTKLPTFTVAGNQVQMGGVIGSTLIGVNAFGEWPGWAMMLADWLTNENSQIERFHVRSMGPSNIAAAVALADALQEDLAASAFAAQAPFSWSILPGGGFWGPMETLGEIIVQGNPDGHDLQYLLDSTVEAITG
jgi:arabinogalactan oligomer/maltooligosaccharide transport system substrate-binding protein